MSISLVRSYFFHLGHLSEVHVEPNQKLREIRSLILIKPALPICAILERMQNRQETFHLGVEDGVSLVPDEVDAAANRDILTTAELAVDQRRSRSRSSRVSWYGRVVIVATLSVAAFWELFHLLVSAFMAR